jgi:hypothetical protein
MPRRICAQTVRVRKTIHLFRRRRIMGKTEQGGMMEQELIEAAAQSAERMGVETEALAAVAMVESGGTVMTSVNGRQEPVIRFEGHYFDRRLKGEQRLSAQRTGLASPVAGKIKNPASQTARWALVERAAAINRQAAYESTSFGVGQVMGAHWKWIGYASVEALVEDARSGLAGQIRLIERFIGRAGLSHALRSKDWAAFARGYNGPGYRRNAYDRKLAEAYVRLKKLKADTAKTEGPVLDCLQLGMKGEAVEHLQRLLGANGHEAAPDGIFGPQTKDALRRFQVSAGLKPDGICGPATRTALEAADLAAKAAPGFATG